VLVTGVSTSHTVAGERVSVEDARHKLLTDKEAAAVLRVSVSLLRKWRLCRDGGPPFYRVGRVVRYSLRAIEIFLQEREIRPGVRDRKMAPGGAQATASRRP
jgi:hypothetical protein